MGCRRTGADAKPAPVPKAYGTAIQEVNGGLQYDAAGSVLDQPVIVQVNDAQGNAVPGALVTLSGAPGMVLTPARGLTGDDGQFSATCQLAGAAGREPIVAVTPAKSGKAAELRLEEIGLDYQQNLGSQLNRLYCARCHNQESSAERVSNYDNLDAKPHSFTNGVFYNAMNSADLDAIIAYGGAARNKSAEMPPYGGTLDKPSIEALAAFIRAVSTPPYRVKGMIYASR